MKTHYLRLPGTNSRHHLLPEPVSVTYFQKKTGSWKKLHKRNYTSVGKRTCHKNWRIWKEGALLMVLAHATLTVIGCCYWLPVQESLAMISHVRLSLLNL